MQDNKPDKAEIEALELLKSRGYVIHTRNQDVEPGIIWLVRGLDGRLNHFYGLMKWEAIE